ncbi:MAG: aldehyde dehydrogenase family protein [Bacteroidetes bacterium]|nr:aldehyde dehydrogenase family protein [Bacteroidota bacterium]
MMAAVRNWGILVGGEWHDGPDRIEVRNAFDNERVGTVVRGTEEMVFAAISAAETASLQAFPAHERYDVLMDVAALIDAAADEYADTIAREGSKTISEARHEPPRTATIFRLAADESRRIAGETLPFDIRPGSENRKGYYTRRPVGVVAAIMPFNDPMAVTAHKIGPAIAAGNSVVVKPDSSTPLSILRMAEDFMTAGLPPGRLNVVTGHGSEIGDAIVRDPRVRLVAFTGGVATGRQITKTAGIKKLLLELGANSPVIVMPDADLENACSAIIAGAFAQAGQNCLGVQRIFIHKEIYTSFSNMLVEATGRLKAGHSMDESVDVCQMIRLRDAERVDEWVNEAVAEGASILTGGSREGAVYEPTLLENVPSGAKLECDEIYGPVSSLFEFEDLFDAVDRANAVDFGLHAAIFTESLRDAFYAVENLNVGAVIVNDSTDYRLDSMPFGGFRSSGVGREGIRFAVEAMTETRVACFNL